MGKGVNVDLVLATFYDDVLFGKKLGAANKRARAAGRGGVSVSSSAQSKAEAAREKLNSLASNKPEVMIKISGGGKGMSQVRAHLDYVSRKGELALEDQDGNIIKGKDAVKDYATELQQSGSYIPEDGKLKEAFNIVLSMPPGTDRLAVERASRDFAKEQFSNNFQYAFVRHDDEAHPHVHLVVKARGFDGKRLNPRKADLHTWRESFVVALHDHGIDAVATKRQQRLRQTKGLHQSILHMLERGEIPDTQGTASDPLRVQKARATETHIREQYAAVLSALKEAGGADKQLAERLETRLFGSAEKVQEQSIER